MRKVTLWFGFAIILQWAFGPRVIGQDCKPYYPPPVVEVSRSSSDKERWVDVPGSSSFVACVRGTNQLGVYNFATGYYHEKIPTGWSGPAVAPIDPPFAQGDKLGGSQAFGVAPRTGGDRERFFDADREYTRDAFEDLLTANLRDDSKAAHVTVITRRPEQAKRAADEWEKIKQQTRAADQVRFQAYDLSHPVVQQILAPNRLEIDEQFAKSGSVVLAQFPGQEPDGRAKALSWYEQPAPQVLIEALRRVDPNFNPNVRPGPILPAFPPLGDFVWVVLGVAGLGVLLAIGACFNK